MSMRVDVYVTIQCPIEEVFERLISISDYSEWLPQQGIFKSTRQTSGEPIGLGTTYTDETRLGTFHGEITEFERPTKVVFRHRLRWLGLPVIETSPGYALESVDGDTKLHHFGEGRLFGIFKFMRPRAASIARHERHRVVDALKKSMEETSS